MRVLIGCEQSQTVCQEFRKRGHEAFSCDILPTDGNPELHYQKDVFDVINMGWDMAIFHPPCTRLAVSGSMHFHKYEKEQEEALEFVRKLLTVDINKICLENPVSVISSKIRKPDQIINPYYFGDEYQKTTCLWLKNLPKLFHAKEDDLFAKKTHVGKGEFFDWIDGKTGKAKRQPLWYYKAAYLPKQERQKLRSKTFQGIAKAMAEQWG